MKLRMPGILAATARDDRAAPAGVYRRMDAVAGRIGLSRDRVPIHSSPEPSSNTSLASTSSRANDL